MGRRSRRKSGLVEQAGELLDQVTESVTTSVVPTKRKRHRGRKALLLLGLIALGGAVFSAVRRGQAGPAPAPPAPPAPRPTPAQAPAPSAADEPTVPTAIADPPVTTEAAPETGPESEATPEAKAAPKPTAKKRSKPAPAAEPDTVSDPLVDPLAEGAPARDPEADTGSFFEQVLAETGTEPVAPARRRPPRRTKATPAEPDPA